MNLKQLRQMIALNSVPKISPVVAKDLGVTLAELDETIGYLFKSLKVDKYGQRMDWRKKQVLEEAIDDLLDERLNLSKVNG